MSTPQNVIAIVFDFDDTLTDDSTTKLLEAHGIDPSDFWKVQVLKRQEEGWDPSLAYLSLLIEHVGKGKPFGELSNADLRRFGAGLKFYPGIPGLFRDLRKLAESHRASHPVVEFYIISGGLEEIIRGSSIAKHFTDIWGCRFAEKDGQICDVMNVVSFTEKTKFLYAIHKGVSSLRERPFAVNEYVDAQDRRVPFRNMIYIGDGLTDVPCFSMLEHFRGRPFGVFDPKREGSPKKAWEQLVTPRRVTTIHSPRYHPKDDLGALLRVAVDAICSAMDVDSNLALKRGG